MSDEVFHGTVYFTGHVQGVGFRFTTYQLAKGYEVTGFVKNLPDGRVHLEVEGQRKECMAFIRALSEEMAGFIRSEERKDGFREPAYRQFVIA
ncbi:MAG: acylphosphatase [Opitutae bacterium]|nr:acylphosphatase [Opitutae bacterium]